MIKQDQAINALKYLEAAAQNMHFEDEAHKTYNDGMRQNAVKLLKQFIADNKSPQDIKVVYEFKLRRADGQYLDKSNWSKKGKTYKNRNNMSIAIGYNIENDIARLKGPKYDTAYVVDCSTGKYKQPLEMTPEYEAYHAWNKMKRENKEFRAHYIPEDWTIICIPVNTKSDIIEISAREFYMGKPIE